MAFLGEIIVLSFSLGWSNVEQLGLVFMFTHIKEKKRKTKAANTLCLSVKLSACILSVVEIWLIFPTISPWNIDDVSSTVCASVKISFTFYTVKYSLYTYSDVFTSWRPSLWIKQFIQMKTFSIFTQQIFYIMHFFFYFSFLLKFWHMKTKGLSGIIYYQYLITACLHWSRLALFQDGDYSHLADCY